MSLMLVPTKTFSVLAIGNVTSLDAYKVNSGKPNAYDENTDKQVVAYLKQYGCCVRSNIIGKNTVQKLQKELRSFAKILISNYNEQYDEFSSIDTEGLNIERMPRIGKGKHNIHFCPLMSRHHKLMSELAEEGHYSETLSMYMDKHCTLRETGISLTRPAQRLSVADESTLDIYSDLVSQEDGGVIAGEGMEWHSDGAAGEATVLMAVEDIDENMGSLRVIPKSHLMYVDGIGHDENVLKNSHAWLKEHQVVYEYRAGEPMMIDARTLHSVSRNVSDKWRMIMWFIYDSY